MGDPPKKEKRKGKPMSEEPHSTPSTPSDNHGKNHTGTRSDTYAELAAVGPYGVHPGHALPHRPLRHGQLQQARLRWPQSGPA